MNPFEFSIPQNIIVGAGTLAKLPECAKKMGGTHAMILSGPTLKKMGVVDKAADSLKAAGIAAGVVRPMSDVLRDPHLHERGFWQSVDRDFVGQYLSSTTPYRQGDAPMPIRSAAPTLGQHTAVVLGELLALDAASVATLEKEGVIGTLARRKSARPSE